ncbi:MAG: hypothetical protein IKB34_08630 [Clostridia bacterium]|nr:hypothetical protein [Clostridia bacterium]
MKIKKSLYIIFTVIAISGIVLAFVGRALCVDHPKDYRAVQEEITVPEEISDVWVSEERIYVCYRVASCVNVYDKSGNFLWAVSAPFMRTASFMLMDEKLIIYNAEAFVYNVTNGEFIEVTPTKEIKFPDVDDTSSENKEETPRPGDVVFDWYTVSILDSNSTPNTIYSTPKWYWIFNFYLGFTVSAIGSLGISSVSLFEKTKAWLNIRGNGKITHREAKKYLLYIRVTSAIQLLCAIVNIFIGSTIAVTILTVHFVVAGVIMYNLIENLSCTEYEYRLMDFWKAVGIATFILAFLTLSFCL